MECLKPEVCGVGVAANGQQGRVAETDPGNLQFMRALFHIQLDFFFSESNKSGIQSPAPFSQMFPILGFQLRSSAEKKYIP